MLVARLSSLLPALLLLTGVATAQASGSKATRPNIIFIFSDDHAAQSISAYGSNRNDTPNIDRLANEGVLFRNCFCGNSICGPSRATLLSGKHSHANGFRRNGDRFDPLQTTFPPLLQEAGYQTAMIGKWHLRSDPVGFDHWEVLPGQGSYYNPDFRTKNGRRRVEGYCTDVTTDLALQWLEEERKADQPFMLMLHHKAPHRPWMPGPDELGLYRKNDMPVPATLFDDYSGRMPIVAEHAMGVGDHLWMAYDLWCPIDEGEHLYGAYKSRMNRMTPAQKALWHGAFEAENEAFRANPPTGKALVEWKYQRYVKNYLRCIAGVDKNVGRVLDWVDHAGIADNTVVIYCSDQGFYLGEHGWYDKRWMYEESLRMPFIVRWPGHAKTDVEVTDLAQNIDFAPTFLDLAGADIPEEMHGESLVPLLKGERPSGWRDSIYYHYYETPSEHQVALHYGVRTARYKLIRFPEQDGWELFDLREDPNEMRSVYGKPDYAEITATLKRELERLRKQFAVPAD